MNSLIPLCGSIGGFLMKQAMDILFFILALFGLGTMLWLAGAGAKSLAKTGRQRLAVGSPFVDLDVAPVSEGDTVCYAYKSGERYTALVENRQKQAKLSLEADSREELVKLVESTFKAWSIAGKKKVAAL